MRVPTIHLNGTSKAVLLVDYQRAADALMDARNAVAACAPNGRDYYPQGSNAIVDAMQEHADRARRIAEIRTEIVEIMAAIEEGRTTSE